MRVNVGNAEKIEKFAFLEFQKFSESKLRNITFKFQNPIDDDMVYIPQQYGDLQHGKY